MRIGIFTNYYPPSLGGIENSVMGLQRGLEKAGHKVFIFAPYRPDIDRSEKNVFRYKSLCFRYDGYFYSITLPSITRVRDVVRSLNLDIFHSQQPFLLGYEALKFSKEMSKPLVLTYHKPEVLTNYIPFVSRFIPASFIMKKFTNYFNECDTIIAPSSSVKNLILGYGTKVPIEIIPTGIDIERYKKNNDKRREIRDKYKIKSSEILLLLVSRISREKNLKFLLEAFSLVIKKNKNIKFMMAGGGIMEKELKDLAVKLGLSGNVIFTGSLLGNVQDIYSAGDIFVFSSLTEAQGLVINEAMASGLPVVAIRASGVEDSIIDGKNGFLTENSVDDFSDKVLKLADNANLREQFSREAIIGVEKFSYEPWIKKIVNLYESLV